MNEIVLPSHSNALGSAFGGQVLAWIDICAAIAAQRHCQTQVVTASIDEVHFRIPIRVGMVASLRAEVNATFKKSLELGVTVYSEDPLTTERKICCVARLTFAALDDQFRPTLVPPLRLDDDAVIRRQRAGEARRAARLKHRMVLKE
jgi:acyl-CoA hydrolase